MRSRWVFVVWSSDWDEPSSRLRFTTPSFTNPLCKVEWVIRWSMGCVQSSLQTQRDPAHWWLFSIQAWTLGNKTWLIAGSISVVRTVYPSAERVMERRPLKVSEARVMINKECEIWLGWVCGLPVPAPISIALGRWVWVDLIGLRFERR